MLVRYFLQYNDGNLCNSHGVSVCNTPEGQEIAQQIDDLVEKHGLVRASAYRTPETLDLSAAIDFLSACESLSSSEITVEARIICPIESYEETLKEYQLQPLSSVSINLVDEKGYSPGFVWCGCQWAWHDFENNRRGFATSKNQAIALLIESLRSNSLEVLFSPEIQEILENNEGIHDPRLFP